jgi:error-prone DNA polymerase
MKVDILALGMLTAIRKCFSLVKQHYNQELTIADITKKQDDADVYAMLQSADTVGVFQIESRAQMSMLPRLKPTCYYDLVIQIAIVRPGPIQGDMVHPFLKRRSGEEEISYPSEEVKAVLSRTLGVPIFQEQVIKLAMVAAGFTGGEADQLRRAMASWKKTGELEKFRSKLINGMQERGYETSFAKRIFEQICGFGEYGFPESHSASFAVLAYVSAWLKYYYPAAFYTSLLNSLPMGFYSASQLIQDAKRHQLIILPVCINQSHENHRLVEHQNTKAIRLGLTLIKGLSKPNIEVILNNRPEGGFKQLNELKRLSISSQSMQQLASANALQQLSGDRYSSRWQLMDNEDSLPLFANEPVNSNTLLGKTNAHNYLSSPSEFDTLTEDYAATGLTLNCHPIALLNKSRKLKKHIKMQDLTSIAHKSLVTIIGLVTGRQSPGTASGVTFVTLEDDTGNMNVIIWAGTARAQKQPFMTAKILQVTGILEREGEVTHVIAGKLVDLTPAMSTLATQSRDFH